MTLRLRNASLSRGAFRLRIDRWEARPGELHALLGANGAGKSTLFAVLGGEAVGAGCVELYGKPLGHWAAAERARHLGVLPQSSSLSFPFTAEEVVALGLTPLRVGWREGRQRLQRCMQRTDCAHLARRPFPGLSGGERQRVSLARVLLQLSEAQRAPVLLLDEPTSAQDLGQQHRLLQLAGALAAGEGYAVVAILHDLNQALRYAQRVTVLDSGSIAASGRPAEVLTPRAVARHWGYRPQLVQAGDGLQLLA